MVLVLDPPEACGNCPLENLFDARNLIVGKMTEP